MVVLQTKMAHVDLHLFTHGLFRLIAKLLSYFEEALFDFMFNTRVKLFLHVVKFEVLALELF